MRLLVTGANGFVGRTLVPLALTDHAVGVLDSLRYGPWRFSPEELKRLSVFEADIRDEQAVQAAIEAFAPDAIIHLAAIHFIPECERLPNEAISINIEGTVNLARFCPPGARFVLASTAAVYAPSREPHREHEDVIAPVDVYGLSKLAAEGFVKHYAAAGGFESVIIRLFNVVGPGETSPHIVPEIIKQLSEGKRELRLGNISPKRDYINVADAARGFILAATEAFPGKVGESLVANLGTGRAYSVEELISRISAQLGESIKVVIDESRVRKVDRPMLAADITAMSRYFAWEPRYDIEDSLRASLHEGGLVDAPSTQRFVVNNA